MKDYITLSEAAELEEIKYNTMVQKIKRNSETFDIKTEKPEAGGKERVLIAVDSLSKTAQRKYKKLRKINEPTRNEIIVENLKPEEPWYLDIDVNWYAENYKTAYYKAVELSRSLQDIVNYSETDKTEYMIRRAGELGMSQRTLYRNIDKYLEAAGWALKMLKETGASYDYYKVLCLCRKPKDSNTFPTFTPEVKAAIPKIWINKGFAKNQCSRQQLYDKLLEISALNGWPIPSYQSVCRYIAYLMEHEHLESARCLVEEGTRTWKNKHMVKARRDTKSLEVMEILFGDAHTFDCWVSYKLPNGKITAIRPTLVAWIDGRSRMPLGDVICEHCNAQVLKNSLVKVFYGNPGGMPKILYIDNGKDFTAEEMTGVERKERYPGFDEVINGFYHTVGIEDFHRSRPYEPWDKSEIERWFKTICDGFTRWFGSYTGTLTGSKTDAKIDKNIKKLLEQGKLVTFEEFYERWNHYLNNVYAMKEHRGLKAQGEIYCRPLDLFKNGERYEKALPPKDFVVQQMMKSDRARVRNIGIQKFGQVYNHPELDDYRDKMVNIKYDPEDIKRLWVYAAEDNHQICVAESQELLKFAHRVPQEEVEKHIKNQKRQYKKVRQIVEEANKPLDESIAGAAEANSIIGNMIIEGKGNSQKVIALPKEESYREYKKAARQSEYIARQGQEALEKIRNMG